VRRINPKEDGMETKTLTVAEIENSYSTLLKLNKFKPTSDAARYKLSRNLTFFELELKPISETKKSIREDCKVTVTRQPGSATGVVYQAAPEGWDKTNPANNGPDLVQAANDLLSDCFERLEVFNETEQEIIKFRELNYPKDFPAESTGEDLHRLIWLVSEKSILAYEKLLEKADEKDDEEDDKPATKKRTPARAKKET